MVLAGVQAAVYLVANTAVEPVRADLAADVGFWHYVRSDARRLDLGFQLARHGIVVRGSRRAAEPPGSPEFAADAFLLDQVADERDEADALVEDALRAGFTVVRLQAGDAQFVKTRTEHAAITGAGAIAQQARFAHEHRLSSPGKDARSREAAVTRTDNQHIGFVRQLGRRSFRAWRPLPPVGIDFQSGKNIAQCNTPRMHLCLIMPAQTGRMLCSTAPDQNKNDSCKTTVFCRSYRRC